MLFIFVAFFIIALLSLGIFSSKLLLIIMFLLIPTFTAIIFEKSRDRCLSLCVGFLNISAILFYSPIIIQTLSPTAITQLFSADLTYFVYLSCLVGLALYLLLPYVIRFAYELVINFRKTKLQAQIERLTSKWEI